MSFKKTLADLDEYFEHDSMLVHTDNWQGTSIKNNSQAQMCEVLHESIRVKMGHRDLNQYREDIKPNLPWADNHFNERTNGQPLNPGIEWANWPWSNSADSHRDSNGQFNHNYMERYWPKYAGRTNGGTLSPEQVDFKNVNLGLRHEVGDLGDLIELLRSDPSTRQAYLPVWFPEDTGLDKSQRKPCSLGYHFIIRNGQLDITYFIRSCDYHRHLRDDIYMTIRLGLWILEQCGFDGIEMGRFNMHITSLHMFVGDYSLKYGRQHHDI